MVDSSDKPNYPLSSDPHRNRSGLSQSDAIAKILKSSKTIAVVGLSNKRKRPSYGVAQYLQSAGYRIIPVNPNETQVLGEKSYARLQDVPVPVDIVDIFRRSEFVPEVVDSAIQIGTRSVWMQEGVIHSEAAERARRAGIFVVMNLCILKEHIRRAHELRQTTKSS
jgi:predicted CoA-binding protein